MTLEDEKLAGQEVNSLLNNPKIKLAFERLDEALEQKIYSCNPDKPEETQRAVLAKQIMMGLKREFYRIVEDGELARIQLEELEKRGKLRRMIR